MQRRLQSSNTCSGELSCERRLSSVSIQVDIIRTEVKTSLVLLYSSYPSSFIPYPFASIYPQDLTALCFKGQAICCSHIQEVLVIPSRLKTECSETNAQLPGCLSHFTTAALRHGPTPATTSKHNQKSHTTGKPAHRDGRYEMLHIVLSFLVSSTETMPLLQLNYKPTFSHECHHQNRYTFPPDHRASSMALPMPQPTRRVRVVQPLERRHEAAPTHGCLSQNSLVESDTAMPFWFRSHAYPPNQITYAAHAAHLSLVRDLHRKPAGAHSRYVQQDQEYYAEELYPRRRYVMWDTDGLVAEQDEWSDAFRMDEWTRRYGRGVEVRRRGGKLMVVRRK